MTAPDLVGQVVWAETDGAGKRVRIEVTSVEATSERGSDVWGYRVAVRARRAGRQTMYPRRYFRAGPIDAKGPSGRLPEGSWWLPRLGGCLAG